jgi:hypothetical protein
MNYTSKLIVALVFVSAFMLEPAFAESTRCGQHIISSGERHGTDKYEVLKKCGEPTIRTSDTWIYERSQGKKVIMVFNANGDLSRIK